MSESTIPKKRRWGRRLFFFILLLSIAGVSVALWLGSVAGSRLEAELAHIRNVGEPITLAELAPPPIPDAENAAPLLLEAFELVEEEPDAWYDDDALDQYEEDPFGQDDAWYAELAAWVERNEPALGKAHEASARPGCRFDLEWEKGVEMETPQVWGLLTISRVLRARAVLAARAGDVDGAIATCAEMVRLAEIGLQDPLVIYLLVRAALVNTALETAQGVLAQGRAATGALENLLARLSTLPGQDDLHRVFLGERTFGYDALSAVRADPGKVDEWAEFGWDLGIGRSIVYRLLPDTMLKLDSAHYLALMRRTLELSRRPYREARSDWSALRSDLEDRPWYAVVSPAASAVFPTVVRKWTMHETRVDLARLGLYLVLYAREHGELPGSFADLSVPLPVDDRFGSAPCVLKTLGDGGWLVYSVGPDGKDDGGAPLDDDEKGDLVWRHVAHP